MAITQISRDFNETPNIVRMETSDALATVAGAGYLTAQASNLADLNSGTWTWLESDMVLCFASDGLQLFTLSADLTTLEVYSTAGNGAVSLPVVSGNFVTFDGTLGALGDLGYLPSDASKTRVVMANGATVANRIACFTDTTGTIDDTTALATHAGNIAAGLSGTAGTVSSFPATVTTGSLVLQAVSNTGDTLVTISNALHGQASVYSIPDSGASTANFIISKLTGTQHITVGSLQVDAGNLTAGSSGSAGYVASFPAGAASGSLRLQGVANSGDTLVTISNASHGQATVYSIPDVGAATGQLLNKTAAFVSGNLIAASGTAGKTVDAGAPTSGLYQVASVAMTAAEWNGMYAAPKLLVAAPGANNLIVVDRVVAIMTFVSAAYAAGGVVGFQYDSTVNGAGVAATNTEAAADFFAAASTSFQFTGVSGNTVAISPFTTTVNKGLYISNLTGAFTTGDSTWVIKVYYRIIAVA
jgi:hypothetical protein